MFRIWLSAISIFWVAAPSYAQGRDPVMVEFMRRLMYETGFAQEEFGRLASVNPPLAAYFIAASAHEKCGFSAPSEKLKIFSKMADAVETDDGMRMFAASVAVSTLNYPTADVAAKFCASAKSLVERAELEAAKAP